MNKFTANCKDLTSSAVVTVHLISAAPPRPQVQVSKESLSGRDFSTIEIRAADQNQHTSSSSSNWKGLSIFSNLSLIICPLLLAGVV